MHNSRRGRETQGLGRGPPAYIVPDNANKSLRPACVAPPAETTMMVAGGRNAGHGS